MARADLSGDVERLRAGWGRSGALVGHGGTAFLFEGQSLDIELPRPVAADPPCQSLIVVAERPVRFDLLAAPLPSPGDDA
ncbi:MAG: hypothetical protein JRI23_20230, partial [Deltaproteobacteria bacterium]|nr:hypothetical protein [Deltaproteobacteria bacterium]MBW2534214.1 hypothetical protein [Deltaproteobacteria bacterium]